MALFGKKLTAEEIIKAYKALSDEDKEKVIGAMTPETTEEPEPEETEETTATETAETTEQGETEETGETAEETETTEETATDDVTTEEGKEENEAEALETDKTKEVYEAMSARISALEEKLSEVTEMLTSINTAKEGDFGARSHTVMPEKDDEMSEDDRIMRNFYGNSYRR